MSVICLPGMNKSSQDYEINEKDIDAVLNILKKTDPDNATPEMAIAILEHLQATVHELGHTNPDLLLEIFEDLKKQKEKEGQSEG